MYKMKDAHKNILERLTRMEELISKQDDNHHSLSQTVSLPLPVSDRELLE